METSTPRDRAVDLADRGTQVVLGGLLLLFPLFYGWAPVDMGGDTTVAQSLAVTVFEIGAGLLGLLLAFKLLLGAPFSRGTQSSGPLWPLVALGAGLLVLCAVQFLPLPADLHGFLSPEGGRVLDRFQTEGGGHRTLTLLPGESFLAFLKVSAYFLVFLASAALVRSREDVRRFMVALTVLGSVIAFLGILKGFAPNVLSFLFPQGGTGRAAGPFINPNHFAGYLELCFPMALATFVMAGPMPRLEGFDLQALADFVRMQGWKKALAGFACLLMAGGVIASLSRLGIFAFVFSLFVFFFVLFRGRGRKFAFGAVVLVAFVAIFLTSVYIGLDPVLERYSLLEDAGVNRLDAWRMGASIAADYPLTGSGLGTFRYISPLYQPATLKGGFHQTHNDYLNLAADLGLPALGLALAFLVVWVRRVVRCAHHTGFFRPAAAAAFAAATMAMAVHSIGDFNFQVASNGMVWAMVLGFGLGLTRVAASEISQRGSGLYELGV